MKDVDNKKLSVLGERKSTTFFLFQCRDFFFFKVTQKVCNGGFKTVMDFVLVFVCINNCNLFKTELIRVNNKRAISALSFCSVLSYFR